MYLKQHQYEETDITKVSPSELTKSTGENLVAWHPELLSKAKKLPLLTIVREPLVRFLASYKDKILRLVCFIASYWSRKILISEEADVSSIISR